MELTTRKKKVIYTQKQYDNAKRKLALAWTVTRRWERRLKSQTDALQRETEERVTTQSDSGHLRRFRNE